MDRVLERGGEKYRQFVRDLVGRGVLRWVPFAKENASVFFVKKKGDRQRLVADPKGRSLIPPARNIAPYWGFVIRPREERRATKMWTFDDAVLWDVLGMNWSALSLRAAKRTDLR